MMAANKEVNIKSLNGRLFFVDMKITPFKKFPIILPFYHCYVNNYIA